MFKNSDERLRSGWKILFVSLAFFGITLAITYILGIVIGIMMLVNGNMEILNPNSNSPEAQLINLLSRVIQSLCMIFVPVVAWKAIMKRKLKDMGLSSIWTSKKDLIMGLFLGAISITVVFLLFIVTGFGKVDQWMPRVSLDTFTYLLIFILVGFCEEIYGRGFIMGAMKQTKNIPLIIIVSSVIFALLHGSNAGFTVLPFVNLTLVGALFAYMYIKSDNIWMCIGYHITWNYFQGNVFGLNVSGSEVQGLITTTMKDTNIFTGKEFGPEGGLFVTFVLVINFLIVALFYRNKKVDFLASEREYEEQLFLQTHYPYQQTYDMNNVAPMPPYYDMNRTQATVNPYGLDHKNDVAQATTPPREMKQGKEGEV